MFIISWYCSKFEISNVTFCSAVFFRITRKMVCPSRCSRQLKVIDANLSGRANHRLTRSKIEVRAPAVGMFLCKRLIRVFLYLETFLWEKNFETPPVSWLPLRSPWDKGSITLADGLAYRRLAVTRLLACLRQKSSDTLIDILVWKPI